MKAPRLTLLATGGTIASGAGPQGRLVAADGAQLLARARQVWPIPGEVDVVDVAGVASSALSLDQVVALARQVAAELSASAGLVITHGTDTMEETAFVLALHHAAETPVVLTGAQRPLDDPATDGPRNLAAALRWAASPQARGTGVTLVFADHVLPAIGAHKAATLEAAAFAAPGRGSLGRVDETGVRCHARPVLPPPLLTASDPAPRLPRVDVLPQYLGADEALVDALLGAGARGLVVAGLGAGNTPPTVTRRLVALLGEGFPVLVASRTGSGATVGLYAGGGADLAAAGAVMAGDLSPWQARLLLTAVLAAGTDDWAVRARQWLMAAGAGGH